MCDWIDAKVVGTPLSLSTEVALGDANIVVSDPSECLVLQVLGKKRICSSFDDYMVQFHECLLTRVGF